MVLFTGTRYDKVKTERKNTMERHKPEDDLLPCPSCGGPTKRMKSLDGLSDVTICPVCSSGPTPVDAISLGLSKTNPPEVKPNSLNRIEQLHSQTEATASSDQFPRKESRDQPEETRASHDRQLSPPSPSSKTEELSEDIAAPLRDMGYVISQDGHGVRISGNLSSRHANIEPLSPYDIIRIAADLEGGILPPEERLHCTKCDAVVSTEDTKCQWCGEPNVSNSHSS